MESNQGRYSAKASLRYQCKRSRLPWRGAILAGKAVGLFASVESACESMVDIVARYEPNPVNREVYDKGYAVYKKLQTDCAGLFDMLV